MKPWYIVEIREIPHIRRVNCLCDIRYCLHASLFVQGRLQPFKILSTKLSKCRSVVSKRQGGVIMPLIFLQGSFSYWLLPLFGFERRLFQAYEDSESLSVQQLNVYADEEICILCPMYITLAHLCPLLHCH